VLSLEEGALVALTRARQQRITSTSTTSHGFERVIREGENIISIEK
jgi:hypothetical protein